MQTTKYEKEIITANDPTFCSPSIARSTTGIPSFTCEGLDTVQNGKSGEIASIRERPGKRERRPTHSLTR